MMRVFAGFAALIAVSVAGSAVAGDLKRIESAAAFQAQVVGKYFGDASARMIVTADGRISGKTAKGQKIIGRWVWGNGFFCRTVKVGSTDLGNNCQIVKASAEAVTFTRDQGRGDTSGPFSFE